MQNVNTSLSQVEKSIQRKAGDIGLTLYTLLPQILSIIGTIGIALSSLFIDTSKSLELLIRSKTVLTLLASISFFCIGEFWSARKANRGALLRNRIADLEDALNKAQDDYYQVTSTTLFNLAKELRIRHNGSDRLSVYKHDGRAFVIVGRHSKNPMFNERGRSYYPDTQGVIGVAWKSADGEATANQFPDFEGRPENYLRRVSSEYDIVPEIIQEFKMKSRSYAVITLDSGPREERIAVLVYESTDPNPLDIKKLKQYRDTEAGRKLLELLENKQSLMPSPSYAEEKGF